MAGQSVPAAEMLAGHASGSAIEPATLMFFDLAPGSAADQAEPLSADQVARLHGSRPAGHHHDPAWNRSGSSGGPRMPASSWWRAEDRSRPRPCLQTVTIAVSETTLASSWTTAKPG